MAGLVGEQLISSDSHNVLSQPPQGARLRFVASDATGLPVKRKQVQHACLACRRKKKRCNHGPEADGLSQSPDDYRQSKRSRRSEVTDNPGRRLSSPNNGTSPGSPDIDEAASTAASHLLGLSDRGDGVRPPTTTSTEGQEDEDPQARFVGDLNPENILISAMAEVSRAVPSPHYQRDSAIGIWKEPVRSSRHGHNSARKPLPSGSVNGSRVSISSRTTSIDDIAPLEEALRVARENWLDRCLGDIDPPPTAFACLRSIYMRRIQPLFPIFDEKRLMSLGNNRIDRAIKLVVCLAAATDRQAAKPHLRLEGYPTTPLSYQEFTGKVSQLVRALIEEIDFSNRLLDQIRILGLMAMYWQPLEEQDWDGPARLFSQAVSIVFSIGLHLEVYDKGCHIPGENDETSVAAHTPRQPTREDIERIFLCIFALDRMMASFYGRPILLNERDFDRDVVKYAARQPPIFRLFILVVWQLNQIQDLYRPSFRAASSLQSAEVSVFERLILESGAQNAPPTMLATIEVFHHAVCALSVRQTRQDFESPPTTGADKPPDYPHLPQPLLNARRSISADRILQITKQYDVGPLPFIPYALSISLSVAYRKWRFSQIPMFQARGRESFMEILAVLEKWGCVFTSARINYNLAQKVVEGMEKVHDNMKRKCRDKTPVGDRSGCAPQSGARSALTMMTNPPSVMIGTRPAAGLPVGTPSGAYLGNRSLPFSAADQNLDTLQFGYPSSSSFPADELTGLNLFNFFDESGADLDVGLGEMDTLFDRNLDPMAPAFWPAYPSLDPERMEAGAQFYP